MFQLFPTYIYNCTIVYILWQKCPAIVGQQGEGRGVAQLEAFFGKNRQR